jgi:hypothetical protein
LTISHLGDGVFEKNHQGATSYKTHYETGSSIMRRSTSFSSTHLEQSLIWLGTPIQGGAAMPRYYFHIHNGYDLELDPDGTDFPDMNDARAEAERMIRDISRYWPQARRYMSIEIVDKGGKTLLRLPFVDVTGLPE